MISVIGPSEVGVQIDLGTPSNSWSFRNAYAGALDLAKRIENVQARRANELIPVKTVAAGEFRSEATANSLSYTVKIPPGRPGDLAHISWLTKDRGLLMPSDLLPESLATGGKVSVDFELPKGWVVNSPSKDGNRFSQSELDNAVFLLGPSIRAMSKSIKGMELRLIVDGAWEFSEKKVLESAGKVLDWYYELTGFRLRSKPTILLAPLPTSNSDARWKAETRGSTVVLLVNPHASIKNWIGQLGIIFTHELFHLWIPNSLAFTGDYDWFFEGFTLYVALQAALKLKLIKFKESLTTLARVYDSYLSYPDNSTLIEASESRWTSSAPLIYDKGMLVAFLYDLTVRLESGGKVSLLDRYRRLFDQSVNEPTNANDVIIRLLSSSPATEGFATSYIQSRNRIELEKVLTSFGLLLNIEGSTSQLSVRKDLTDPQRQVLRSLGYRR